MSRSHAEKVARVLNAHHLRTCAGFYPATGGRAFGARAVKNVDRTLVDGAPVTQYVLAAEVQS